MPLLPTEEVHHINGVRDDNRTDGPLVNFRSGNLELWSKSHPAGQRVEDKIAWAIEILELYAPEVLRSSINVDIKGSPNSSTSHYGNLYEGLDRA